MVFILFFLINGLMCAASSHFFEKPQFLPAASNSFAKKTILSKDSDNKIIGAILYEPGMCRINNVGVNKEWQSKKIGSSLVKQTLEDEDMKACSKVTLEALKTVVPFYQKLGAERDEDNEERKNTVPMVFKRT